MMTSYVITSFTKSNLVTFIGFHTVLVVKHPQHHLLLIPPADNKPLEL